MEHSSRQSVSRVEYGAMLWHLCTKFTLEFTKTFPFEPADKDTLNARVVEVLALHLWSALKAVGTDDNVALDELHRLFLESVNKDLAPGTPLSQLKNVLLTRYAEYFRAWKDNADGSAQQDFAAAALAHVFGDAAAGMSAVDKVKFLSWILGAMAATLKMTGELEVRP